MAATKKRNAMMLTHPIVGAKFDFQGRLTSRATFSNLNFAGESCESINPPPCGKFSAGHTLGGAFKPTEHTLSHRTACDFVASNGAG
jgi:hypothetical protein